MSEVGEYINRRCIDRKKKQGQDFPSKSWSKLGECPGGCGGRTHLRMATRPARLVLREDPHSCRLYCCLHGHLKIPAGCSLVALSCTRVRSYTVAVETVGGCFCSRVGNSSGSPVVVIM